MEEEEFVRSWWDHNSCFGYFRYLSSHMEVEVSGVQFDI